MRERERWGGEGIQQAGLSSMMPPVKSGGQTISLIEFHPGSRQEAPRVVAPLSIERVGRGGGVLMDGVGGGFI